MKFLCSFIFIVFAFVHFKCDYIDDYYLPYLSYNNYLTPSFYSWKNAKYEQQTYVEERVRIDVFYEVFCPMCRDFDTEQFGPVVNKLGRYLTIATYPYGNAQTIEKDGKIEFICQHGPKECYGNKLHACALRLLGSKNQTVALNYNICMMEHSHSDRGSDDAAADRCGELMSIDPNPIKECAKGRRGSELLKYYGEQSKKANFKHVPHILINGVKNDGLHFMRDVCAAFSNPPPECSDAL